MEGGVHHPGGHPFAYLGAQHCLAGSAGHAHPVAIDNATIFRICRVNLQPVFLVPGHAFSINISTAIAYVVVKIPISF